MLQAPLNLNIRSIINNDNQIRPPGLILQGQQKPKQLG